MLINPVGKTREGHFNPIKKENKNNEDFKFKKHKEKQEKKDPKEEFMNRLKSIKSIKRNTLTGEYTVEYENGEKIKYDPNSCKITQIQEYLKSRNRGTNIDYKV